MNENQRLRARVDALVDQIGNEFPQQKLARALTAKAIDVSLEHAGHKATIWMLDQATNRMTHWSPEHIETYLDTAY